jgi:hypothetical protein
MKPSGQVSGGKPKRRGPNKSKGQGQSAKGQGESKPKRNRGGQPGNKNAFKHGFYQLHFDRAEVRDLGTLSADDLASEIAMQRVASRRVFEQLDDAASPIEAAAMLEILAKSNVAVATLMRTKKYLSVEGGDPAGDLQRALAEVVAEMGIAK